MYNFHSEIKLQMKYKSKHKANKLKSHVKQSEFTEIKSTELSIMDLASTGSTVSKTAIEETFKVAELSERKLELNGSSEPKEEVKVEEPIKESEPEELTIDDFIEDFKL